jgi:HK97 gp10 family phage protein
MAKLEVEGLDELLAKLEFMGKEGVSIEDSALVNAVQPILTDMKNTSAFKDETGELRKNLKISKAKKNKYGKYVTVGIDKGDNSKIFYAKFIEWGTSKKPPRAFMQPALIKNKGQVMENFKKEILKSIGSAK